MDPFKIGCYCKSTPYFLWILEKGRSRWEVLFPAGIYLFKVNNRNTRTMWEICSKLTIKTVINYEQILHSVLVFPLLALNK